VPRAATACLLALAVVAAGGCGSSGSDTPASASATPGKPDVTVLMKGLHFAPKRVTIHKGQTVEWIDKDLVDHSVVSGGIESPDFAQGETWSHTFPAAGVIRYHDRLNPQMKGTIVVKR
jgi:plastocyanin